MSKEKPLTFSFLQIHVLFHLMGFSHICHQICTQLNGFETNYACLHDAISKWGETCMREHYHLCEAPFSQYLFFLHENIRYCIKLNFYSENISPSCEYTAVLHN